MIKIEELCRMYDANPPVLALDKVSLEIHKGEFISVVGTSGSGKTTLLSIIGLIDKPTLGRIYFDNHNLSEFKEKKLSSIRGNDIGFVVQDFALIREFTVEENIIMALDFKKNNRNNNYTVTEVLEMVELSGHEKRKISQLSGGQQQRVAIARALIKKPKLLLCDEPTGNLDSNTSQNIIDLLKKINENGTTIVLITHDISIANQTKRIIKLEDGKIMEDIQI